MRVSERMSQIEVEEMERKRREIHKWREREIERNAAYAQNMYHWSL